MNIIKVDGESVANLKSSMSQQHRLNNTTKNIKEYGWHAKKFVYATIIKVKFTYQEIFQRRKVIKRNLNLKETSTIVVKVATKKWLSGNCMPKILLNRLRKMMELN